VHLKYLNQQPSFAISAPHPAAGHQTRIRTVHYHFLIAQTTQTHYNMTDLYDSSTSFSSSSYLSYSTADAARWQSRGNQLSNLIEQQRYLFKQQQQGKHYQRHQHYSQLHNQFQQEMREILRTHPTPFSRSAEAQSSSNFFANYPANKRVNAHLNYQDELILKSFDFTYSPEKNKPRYCPPPSNHQHYYPPPSSVPPQNNDSNHFTDFATMSAHSAGYYSSSSITAADERRASSSSNLVSITASESKVDSSNEFTDLSKLSSSSGNGLQPNSNTDSSDSSLFTPPSRKRTTAAARNVSSQDILSPLVSILPITPATAMKSQQSNNPKSNNNNLNSNVTTAAEASSPLFGDFLQPPSTIASNRVQSVKNNNQNNATMSPLTPIADLSAINKSNTTTSQKNTNTSPEVYSTSLSSLLELTSSNEESSSFY
jgi:hypothetical protein